MEVRLPNDKIVEQVYQFEYVHPTSLTCSMGGDRLVVMIQACNEHDARILAENSPVICDECGRDYERASL